MKQGKNLTRRQKKLLSSKGLNPANWKRIKDLPHELHIVHVHSGKVRVIRLREVS